MLDFSCSETLLTNWALHQANNLPEAIFPYRKGWRCYLNLHYPENGEESYFLTTLLNNSECVALLALDESCQEGWIGKLRQQTMRKSFERTLCRKIDSFQLIYLTCERLRERFRVELSNSRSGADLLVMSGERMYFASGRFKNAVLDYRFDKQLPNPDLLPSHVPANYAKIDSGKEKATFYRSLFHRLNHYWANGSRRVELGRLLAESIPYWLQYRKRHRKELQTKVFSESSDLFRRFLPDVIEVRSLRKKARSHPVDTVEFLVAERDGKATQKWIRQQSHTIRWISRHFHKNPIDISTFIEAIR